jgi:hypothetical protein
MRMVKNFRPIGLVGIIGILLILVGCGLFLTQKQQDAASALTLDQKARLVVDGLQGQLEADWKSCKAYVDASTDPAVKASWKSTIVPLFDKANKTLGTMIGAGGLVSGTASGNMTPDQVQAKMQPILTELIKGLIAIGYKKA